MSCCLSARNLQGISWEQDTACANSFPWEAFSSVSVSCADKGLGCCTERYTTVHELLGFPRPNICDQSSPEMNRVAQRVENCWNNWAHNVMGHKVTSASTCRESRDSACQGQEDPRGMCCKSSPVTSLKSAKSKSQVPVYWVYCPILGNAEKGSIHIHPRCHIPEYSRFTSHSCNRHIASNFPWFPLPTSKSQTSNRNNRKEPIASCFITASISSNSRRWPLTFTFETTQIFGDVWLLCNSYHLYGMEYYGIWNWQHCIIKIDNIKIVCYANQVDGFSRKIQILQESIIIP